MRWACASPVGGRSERIFNGAAGGADVVPAVDCDTATVAAGTRTDATPLPNGMRIIRDRGEHTAKLISLKPTEAIRGWVHLRPTRRWPRPPMRGFVSGGLGNALRSARSTSFSAPSTGDSHAIKSASYRLTTPNHCSKRSKATALDLLEQTTQSIHWGRK